MTPPVPPTPAGPVAEPSLRTDVVGGSVMSALADPFFDDDDDMETLFSSDSFLNDEPLPFLTIPGRAGMHEQTHSNWLEPYWVFFFFNVNYTDCRWFIAEITASACLNQQGRIIIHNFISTMVLKDVRSS